MLDPFTHPNDPEVVEARQRRAPMVPRDLTTGWVCANSMRVVEEINRLRTYEHAVDKARESMSMYASRGIATQTRAAITSMLEYLKLFHA